MHFFWFFSLQTEPKKKQGAIKIKRRREKNKTKKDKTNKTKKNRERREVFGVFSFFFLIGLNPKDCPLPKKEAKKTNQKRRSPL